MHRISKMVSLASSSSSGSSSTDDDDNEDDDLENILGASTLNHDRDGRQLLGRPAVVFDGPEAVGDVGGLPVISDVATMQLSSMDEDKGNSDKNPSTSNNIDNDAKPPGDLLRKRSYPTILHLSYPSEQNDGQDEEGATSVSSPSPLATQQHTELEAVVLLDCLSSNFLFSHLSKQERETLVTHFQEIKFHKNEIILQQGDEVDYLHILYLGDVTFLQNGRPIPSLSGNDQGGERYLIFGELELLTRAPRRTTVKATSDCTLFRLDRYHYQQAVVPPKHQHEFSVEERMTLLKQALPRELKHYLDQDDPIRLRQLAASMTQQAFQRGDVLASKRTRLQGLVVITEGLVQATDNESGGRLFEDLTFGPHESRRSFGWQGLLSSNDDKNDNDDYEGQDQHTGHHQSDHRMMGTLVAASDGKALILSKKAFTSVMGPSITSMQQLAAKRKARTELQQIAVFRDSALTSTQFQQLLDLMHRYEYSKKEAIFQAGQKVEAAMYFVREGVVTLLYNKGETKQVIEAGGYFGEKNMLKDQNKVMGFNKHWEFRSTFAAIADSGTVVDILTLDECRKVVNTTLLGLGQPAVIQSMDETIEYSHLTRRTLLGAGSFGQAWLATVDPPPTKDEEEEQKPPRVVALKIQAKHLIAQLPNKGYGVVAEKNIMASLNSPFVIRLLSTFQDHQRIFLVMSIYQGGELESLIPHDGMGERNAKFYAAGILEGLSYLHRRHIIHRDVKPANVLIGDKGYPVLADFGFAKYVPDKTFTFCGSPMLTAPEIIRYKGHDRGCDNWSWAVLVYRLVTGRYPFYEKGMDELALYKRICRGTFEVDGTMSVELRMLLVAILHPDPTQRLGSRVNGWWDIFAAPWFANDDDNFDLQGLRQQKTPAPWVPDLKDPLDASRFQFDESNVEDMMKSSMPGITLEQQKIFDTFGPHIGLQ